eukprot:jgi/Mesen1/2749/ME000169S01919
MASNGAAGVPVADGPPSIDNLEARPQDGTAGKEEEQVVTPWEVSASGGIDYDKLIEQFGCQKLTDDLLQRVEKLSGKSAHPFLRRGIFFAHRDFDKLLDAYEKGDKFYLYTGRGPYLQEAFRVPLVIQLTDDEKCMWKGLSAKGIFGFAGEDHIGKLSFPPIQAAPAVPSTFPHLFGLDSNATMRCLIPHAIDQDPYFRMTRDAAPRVGFHKPSLIESRFFPALQGESGKMNASDPTSAIFVTDSPANIKSKVSARAGWIQMQSQRQRGKINKYAFSGGGATREEHIAKGANLDVDVSVKYLSFFLDDDDELEHIKQEYKAGRMFTGDVKKRLIEVLTALVERHQRSRAMVTDEMVDAFMAVRPMPHMFS